VELASLALYITRLFLTSFGPSSPPPHVNVSGVPRGLQSLRSLDPSSPIFPSSCPATLPYLLRSPSSPYRASSTSRSLAVASLGSPHHQCLRWCQLLVSSPFSLARPRYAQHHYASPGSLLVLNDAQNPARYDVCGNLLASFIRISAGHRRKEKTLHTGTRPRARPDDATTPTTSHGQLTSGGSSRRRPDRERRGRSCTREESQTEERETLSCLY
jgi:hypothetical protein